MTTISLSQKSVKIVIAAVAVIIMAIIGAMAFRFLVPSTRDKVAIPDNLSVAEWNGKMANLGYYPLDIEDDPTNLAGDNVIMPYGGVVINGNYYEPYEAAEKMSLIRDISVTNCSDGIPMHVAKIELTPEYTGKFKIVMASELDGPLNLISRERFEDLEMKKPASGGILAHYGKIREGKGVTVSGQGMSTTQSYSSEYEGFITTKVVSTDFAIIAVDLKTGQTEAIRIRHENSSCLY